MYVGGDSNDVTVFTIEDGESEGLLTRFTSFVTAICLNNDGSKLLAGARYD